MNLEKLSGVELGSKVNNKEISPVEVIDYFEERVEKLNPKVNAFVYTKFDEARDQAKHLENRILSGEKLGPLAGVPFALKDFLPSKEGWSATHGGVKSLQTIDDVSGEFCKAAEKLGAIAIGKTNAPSFGFRGITDNKMYGPTSTPFKLGYNSGGSSGGSTSAVGSLFVPLAECGDAGGSGRIPAAWCGVFGFKPSAGLVPSVCRPDAWTATHPYCCGGPTSRTIKDAALIMNQMQGYDPRDPISVPIKPIVFDAFNPIKDMKIGVTYDFGVFPEPNEQIIEAIDKCAKYLQSAGAHVDYVKFADTGYSRRELELAWLKGICLDTAIDMELWKADGYDLEKDHYDELPEQFFFFNKAAINGTAMDYRKFHDIRTAILDSQLSVFKDYDIVISPVAGCLPVKNSETWGETKGPEMIGGESVDPLIGFSYTYLQNMTGYPAASVPFSLSKEGLPIGIHVVGRRYRDGQIFDVAHVLEESNPWTDLYNKIEL